jgi:putative phosphoribosyl transferase
MSYQPATESRRGVEIAADGVRLAGDLVVPSGARGVVVFAHGSGSGRVSPRNRAVAGVLNAGGLATLLLDLLTPEEEAVDRRTAHLRFDVALLGRRVIATIDWLTSEPAMKDLRGGVLRRQHGAAAALERVAVLSRDWFLRHLTARTAEQPRRSRSALDAAAP